MTKIRLEIHSAGFKELLTDGATKSLVKSYTDKIAASANSVPSTTEPAATEPYYEVEDASTDRARYQVQTTSTRAARHEAKTLALQRAWSGI